MTTTVLVTGGAGFIGSHAVEELLAHGERVRVLDNFTTGRRENLAGVTEAAGVAGRSGYAGDLEVVEGDVRDTATVAVAAAGCDRVLHLAAIASVSRSFDDPQETRVVNVDGTANVLAAARAAGARRVVLASSCAVYGTTDALPVPEAAPPHPESPYAQSKLEGERLCRAACTDDPNAGTDGFDTAVLRFFNVYGPRQDPSSDYSGVIAIFMDRLARARPCTVYGDGHQSRDFVYVKDVVAACRAALDGRAPGGGPLASGPQASRPLVAEPINVGTGVETTLHDVLAALAAASGREPVVRYAAAREGDIRRSRAACERAAELLGFRASTAFREGLAATWEWYLSTAQARAR